VEEIHLRITNLYELRMPKVLRIINRFNLGGPTYNAAYLTKFLNPDFETLLIGGMKDESEGSSEFICDNIGIRPVIISEMRRELNLKDDWNAYRKIKTVIRDFKPDIVHTHASKAGALGRFAAISEKVPVVIHTFHGHVFHSYFGKLKTQFYKSIEQHLAKKSSKIIAISQKQKKELVNIHKICTEEKVAVIPLGFDLSRFQQNQEEKRKQFREKYQVADDEIAIGIVGRLVPIKNHQLFLEAIKHVQENSTKKIRAFIIGDGELKQSIQHKASELKIDFTELNNATATLTFTSWIKEVDIAYAGLDIVALTSLNEGTPVSLIEAQAAGKPVVSTNVGGVEDVVIKNKTALLSAVYDKQTFFKNLRMIAENDNLCTEMSQKGIQFSRNHFHYSRLVDDMHTLYTALLQSIR